MIVIMDHHAQFHLMLASEPRASCMLDEHVTKCVTPPTWYIIFSFVWRPKVTLDSLVQTALPSRHEMVLHSTVLSSRERGQAAALSLQASVL